MIPVRTLTLRLGLLALALTVSAFFAGCDSGGGDGGGGSSSKTSSVVGKWAMTDSGGNGTWWEFYPEGTFTMFDDPGFTAAHLGGEFKQDGQKVTGTFVNPRVGDGEIDATLSDDGETLALDFIEHWHTPYKHVPLTGTRL